MRCSRLLVWAIATVVGQHEQLVVAGDFQRSSWACSEGRAPVSQDAVVTGEFAFDSQPPERMPGQSG